VTPPRDLPAIAAKGGASRGRGELKALATSSPPITFARDHEDTASLVARLAAGEDVSRHAEEDSAPLGEAEPSVIVDGSVSNPWNDVPAPAIPPRAPATYHRVSARGSNAALAAVRHLQAVPTPLPAPPVALAVVPPPPAPSVDDVMLPPGLANPPTLIRALGKKLKGLGKPHEEVMVWLTQVAKEITDARSEAPGISSGHTMVIMMSALAGIRQTAEGRTERWKRRLLGVLAASMVIMLGLGGVIWFQQRRITHLVSEKVAIDGQIQAVMQEMVTETDDARLGELEARLEVLMGKASDKILQVRKTNAARAEELVKPVDPLEADIRKILKSFGAETYAIPPIFKETMKQKIAELVANPALPYTHARKQRYWPMITKALQAKGLPEELGYIAYAESRFEPSAVNAKSGASGMWQLMDEAARNCGITVNAKQDDRFDAGRSSAAASCYLSKLLIEFGSESFMLALASYNRGENGVRRALHKLTKEPGGFKKRDFWYLYRLKLLPDETREYVPTVIAAAIVLDNPAKYGVRVLGPQNN
jgi:soluble lytic murein transglycosylase-like protein